MLKRRVIPCLDVDRGRVVKGTSFRDLVDAGDPVEQAQRYAEAGADELVFLDISATHEGRGAVYEAIARCAERVFVPLTVGGGMRSCEDIARALGAGADKVAMNTAAVERQELIAEGAARFGSQCIVVAVDVRRIQGSEEPRWEVVTHGGRRRTGLDALQWLARAEALGAGEFLLTSMDQDGQRSGYDLALHVAASRVVRVPVIASGGAGEPAHMAAVLLEGGADAVLAASIFHFGAWTVRGVKRELLARGVPVRLEAEDLGAT
ncbi:MAG: imidazole glycerol phosphate synthase subunit HisF [Planctomycetes bacterium]|nr:imidazole glycerol phosphate synthase subunit HisF [Planctomycetota bacterium]